MPPPLNIWIIMMQLASCHYTFFFTDSYCLVSEKDTGQAFLALEGCFRKLTNNVYLSVQINKWILFRPLPIAHLADCLDADGPVPIVRTADVEADCECGRLRVLPIVYWISQIWQVHTFQETSVCHDVLPMHLVAYIHDYTPCFHYLVNKYLINPASISTKSF